MLFWPEISALGVFFNFDNERMRPPKYQSAPAPPQGTCLLILAEISSKMTMLHQHQVEIVVIFRPYFRSIATHTLWLLQKYEAHINGFPMFLRCTSKESEWQITKIITAFEGECIIIIALCNVLITLWSKYSIFPWNWHFYKFPTNNFGILWCEFCELGVQLMLRRPAR